VPTVSVGTKSYTKNESTVYSRQRFLWHSTLSPTWRVDEIITWISSFTYLLCTVFYSTAVDSFLARPIMAISMFTAHYSVEHFEVFVRLQRLLPDFKAGHFDISFFAGDSYALS